jgi:hypothetical protein
MHRFFAIAAVFAFFAFGTPGVGNPAPVKAASAAPTLSPERALALIRHTFRSHRPPPPYITYTLVRSQMAEHNYPDYPNSYTYHIWCRTSDRAALGRKVFRDDYEYPMEFLRPAFNEDRDPGPPTADVFEPAPSRPHPVEEVPTPEPVESPLSTIASVTAYGETQYHVDSLTYEGNLMHLKLTPLRDPERNRLREIYADRNTYELVRLIAHDRLFVPGDRIYNALFDITMGHVDGHLVVTHIHGDILDNYQGDGKKVEFEFNDIQFPATLPDWYFNPRTYAAHLAEAPE